MGRTLGRTRRGSPSRSVARRIPRRSRPAASGPALHNAVFPGTTIRSVPRRQEYCDSGDGAARAAASRLHPAQRRVLLRAQKADPAETEGAALDFAAQRSGGGRWREARYVTAAADLGDVRTREGAARSKATQRLAPRTSVPAAPSYLECSAGRQPSSEERTLRYAAPCPGQRRPPCPYAKRARACTGCDGAEGCVLVGQSCAARGAQPACQPRRTVTGGRRAPIGNWRRLGTANGGGRRRG